MAGYAKITITLRNARGHSTVRYKGTGRNVSLQMADVGGAMLDGPIYSTASSRAAWEAILDAVVADIAAGNGGGT